jgi:hypothetical protein
VRGCDSQDLEYTWHVDALAYGEIGLSPDLLPQGSLEGERQRRS